MARAQNWMPLLRSVDPIPGDPSAVSAAARRYRQAAQDIERAHASLNRLSYQSKGEAVKKIQERAREIATEVKKAQGRCEKAAEALEVYHPALEDAQRRSLVALERAKPAAKRKKACASRVSQIAIEAMCVKDPRRLKHLNEELKAVKGRLAGANNDQQAAIRMLEAAERSRDEAAERAIVILKDANASSELKDSFWDKCKDALHQLAKMAEALKPILEKISTVFAVVSLVVCAVFPVAAPAMLAIGAGLAVATAACNIISNADKCADGKMDVGSFLFETAKDVIGAAAEVVAAGKAFKVAKAAKQAVGAGKGLKGAVEAAEKVGGAAKKGLLGKAKDVVSKTVKSFKWLKDPAGEGVKSAAKSQFVRDFNAYGKRFGIDKLGKSALLEAQKRVYTKGVGALAKPYLKPVTDITKGGFNDAKDEFKKEFRRGVIDPLNIGAKYVTGVGERIAGTRGR